MRSAITLIEVVVSIVLIASIMVGLLVAHSKHQRQIVRAKKTNDASRLADELLADWFLQGQEIRPGMEGQFSSQIEFYWNTRPSTKRFSNPNWDARFVKFQVFSRQYEEPLVTIELVGSDSESEKLDAN